MEYEICRVRARVCSLVIFILLSVFPACLGAATDASVIDTVLQQHPSYSSIDEKIVLAAHKRLFELFDPKKIYLLDEEVEPYISSSHGKEFLGEFSRHSFNSFHAMLEVCQTAIERARAIRQSLSKQELALVSSHASIKLDGYSQNLSELKKRTAHCFASMIEDRIPRGKRDNETLFEEARTGAEKQCRQKEEDWLFPPAAKKREVVTIKWILRSFMEALDVHSGIMDREEARITRERLTKEGVGTGLTVKLTHDGWMITTILEGSPAATGGILQAGDLLSALDKKPCLEMSAQDIDAKLHSPDGRVRVEVVRQADLSSSRIQTTLLRKQFTILEGRVDWDVRKSASGNIAILQLHAFYRNGSDLTSENDLRNAFSACTLEANISGVILDLRDNGGGYITEAVKVSGLFIKTGVVMMARYSDGSSLVFRDLDKDEIFTGPLIILTSRLTASAAEIVAQSLQDYGRAIVVGDSRTYGKGTIQTQNVTEGRSKTFPLRLTVGSFFTVGGASPEGEGVHADITVPSLWLRKTTKVSHSKRSVSVSPLFHDTLQDIGIDCRPWYQEQYLPFLEQKTEEYRQWIPRLRQNSQSRMHHDPEWSFFSHEETDQKSLREREQSAQLDEAVRVMEDLLQLKEISQKG